MSRIIEGAADDGAEDQTVLSSERDQLQELSPTEREVHDRDSTRHGRDPDIDIHEGGAPAADDDEPVETVHSKRNEIYKQRREERAAASDDDEARTLVWPAGMKVGDETDDDGGGEAGADGDKPADDDAPAGETAAQAKRRMKLKVYGEERELDEDEVRALAQKQLASEHKFGDNKELAERIRTLEAQIAQSPSSQPQDGRTSPEGGEDEVDAQTRAKAERSERYRKAIEDIQLGDAEEGAKALEEILGETRMSEEEIRAQVRQELEQHDAEQRSTAERERVISEYQRDYPEIVGDQTMQFAAARETHDAMVRSLESIGTDPRAVAQARADPATANLYFRDLRSQGYELPDPGEIIKRAADTVLTRYNLRQGGSPTPQPADARSDRDARREEKRQIASEPQRAGLATDRRGPPKPKSREDVVADMRKRRGQDV